MRREPRNQGIAVVTALILLVVVGGIAAIMMTRMLGEVRHTADDIGIVQSLLLARGGANMAGAVLQGPVRAELHEIVEEESSTASRWSFGTGGATSERPTANSVAEALSNDGDAVAKQLQSAIDDLLCDKPVAGVGADREVRLRIHVGGPACGEPVPDSASLAVGRFVDGSPRDGSGTASDQTYALPYVIVAEGALGEYRRNIVLQGEYQFVVGRGSFAQYALFTNNHNFGSSDVWFTDRTLFDGPVHTNEHFRFYRSSWFGGTVTSAGCVVADANGCSNVWGQDQRPGAEFYGEDFEEVGEMQPSPLAPSYTNTYGEHAPEFRAGVDWSASFVPLPENAQDQQAAAQDSGLYFDGDVDDVHLYAGLENGQVVGDGDTATHQYIEIEGTIEQEGDGPGCSFSHWERRSGSWTPIYDCPITTRYRVDPAGAMQERVCGGGTCGWEERGAFNGVLYVDGDVERFRGPTRDPADSDDPADARPALASFSQLTLATDGDVRITEDLAYETPPCTSSPRRDASGNVEGAECPNMNAENILGVYSQNGDVLIGNNHGWSSGEYNAPDNVVVHASLMSGSGVVTVEDYDRGATHGNVNLLGGIIEESYGAFGTFNSSTGNNSTGYGRSFTFDRRTAAGLAPPFFPTIGQDGVTSVVAFSFGQREQVY